MKTITTLFSAAIASSALANTSNLGEGDTYAWAPNLGWIEMMPHRPDPQDGVVVTDTHLAGFAWSDSTGWINFGDGSPANGVRYGNQDGADSGVNHDGAGNLSGLAWSANLGWINFGWAAPNNPDRPRFDIYSGDFDGFAWSANAGWINLGSGILKTDSMIVADSDGDQISDTWELEQAGNLQILGTGRDSDGDGISDLSEYQADTDPLDPMDTFRVLSITRMQAGTSLLWTSRPTRTYRIHLSPDLNVWKPSILGVIAPDAGQSTTRLAPHPPADRQFFRVEAILPLQP